MQIEQPSISAETREDVTRMIESHKAAVARAIAQQIQQTVPRYQRVDDVALKKSVESLLGGVGPLMDGRPEVFEPLVDSVAQLRRTTGFELSDFILAALCFLPVLRKFFCSRGGDLRAGLERYAALESVVVPFVGRVITLFLDADQDATNPDGIDTVTFMSMLTEPSLDMAFAPISIVDVDSEEITEPRRRPK